MLVKGIGSHCPKARRRILVYAVWVDEELEPAKCQAIITLLNAGLCLALVPVALQLCVFIPLSPASCSLLDVRASWSGSTSVNILLQSWDSSSLCAASSCSLRHLHWLKTLSHTKKGSPLIVSTAKCGMLYSIYLNIIYAHWHRSGSALEYQSLTTTEEENSDSETFQQPDSNSYYDVTHL